MAAMEFLKRHIDFASAVTLIITIVLFAAAIFEKGMTHDLLLEAGVFLVSVKLVLASVKSKQALDSIERKLDQILRKE